MSSRIMLTAAFLLVASGYASVVTAMDDEQLTNLKKSNEILAIHFAPSPFVLPSREQASSSAIPPGRFADSTISTGGGLIPYLLGALIDEYIEERRERQQIQQREQQVLSQKQQEEVQVQFVKKYTLEDPIIVAKSRVLAVLTTDHGFENIRATHRSVRSNGMYYSELKTNSTATAVIGFSTFDWGVRNPHASSEWEVYYQADMKVTKLQDEQALSMVRCDLKVRKISTFEQLIENNAALLKEKLNESAEACANDFLDDLLGKQKK